MNESLLSIIRDARRAIDSAEEWYIKGHPHSCAHDLGKATKLARKAHAKAKAQQNRLLGIPEGTR